MCRSDERGFTLIELVVAMGIVAILAGTIVPLAFRELVRAKEDATRKELDAIASGLMEFYEDTGRFPTEGEGLRALVDDPGLAFWQGPYLGGGQGVPADEITRDEFGESYAYDPDPSVSPTTAADVVIASSGSDNLFTSGNVGERWSIGNPGDDLIVLVAAGPVVRDKTRNCKTELEAIAEASREYYEQNASFPTSTSQLSGSYMDPGLSGDAFTDPWNDGYVLTTILPPGAQPLLTIQSLGPDRQDDGGGGDDFSLTVSSEPPGRKSTIRELDIIQSILNENADLHLTGNWRRDRGRLGLGDAFKRDGWDQKYGVNVGARTIYSVGPDGKARGKADNIPKGVGP